MIGIVVGNKHRGDASLDELVRLGGSDERLREDLLEPYWTPHREDPGAKKRRRPAAILAVAHDSPGALHSFGLFVDEHVAAAPLATERTGKRLGVREQDPRLADLQPPRDGGDPPADA